VATGVIDDAVTGFGAEPVLAACSCRMPKAVYSTRSGAGNGKWCGV